MGGPKNSYFSVNQFYYPETFLVEPYNVAHDLIIGIKLLGKHSSQDRYATRFVLTLLFFKSFLVVSLFIQIPQNVQFCFLSHCVIGNMIGQYLSNLFT